MIAKLTIKNFRCFQDFTLDGIRPITLMAGTNNVGKSALLESLFLFTDMNSSDVFLKLNGFRGMRQVILSPKMVWEPLFANMDVNNSIEISIKNNNGETQSVVINKDNSFSLSLSILSPSDAQSVGLPALNSYPLKLCYSDTANEEISHFTLTEKGVALTPQKPINVIVPYTHYLSSNITITPQKVAEWFSEIELKGKKPQCIEVLQKLEPRIKDISVIVIGGISGIFADLGLASRISVNMLGDGMNKLLHIILVMLANPRGVILIDEIENGFHYSFFPKLWEIIGELATMTGSQIFAATHSYECISGAAVFAKDTAKSELFRFVRLDRNNDEITPKVFENDSFEYAIENDWEVR